MPTKKWVPEFPEGQYALTNVMEEVVRARIMELTLNQDICKCQKCLTDMCAIALNNLPGMYVTSQEGRLYAKIPQMAPDFEMTLTVQVTRAIKMVHENPKHGEQQASAV